MDVDAYNYDYKANKNDQTCTYEGKVVFWYDQSVSDDLVDTTIWAAETLTYIVGGEVIDVYPVDSSWVVAPNCNDLGAVIVTKDLGSMKTKTYTYSITDEEGYEVWSGHLQVDANACYAVQLVSWW